MQLAAKYHETKRRRWPVIVEPKIDGFRVWLRFKRQGKSKSISRCGSDWTDLLGPQLWSLHAALVRQGYSEEMILDGELVAGSWADTMRAVRTGDTSKLRVEAFDLVRTGRREAQAKRRAHLVHVLQHARGLTRIGLVPSFVAHDEQEVMQFYQRFIAEGYEGAMIKAPEAPYRIDVRTEAWSKLKPAYIS